MIIEVNVIAESSRTNKGIEYTTLTAMENSPTPLLQMVDYGLRQEEVSHKGKLLGKTVKLHVEMVRALFSGRPQLSGRIMEVKSAGK